MRSLKPLLRSLTAHHSELRAVFFGTSEFAVPSLHVAAQSTALVLVVTAPDRPSGRGQRLSPSPVKSLAQGMGIPVITPEKLQPVPAEITKAKPNILVVASYGKLLPAVLLHVPALGALNVHPSLLPLYRGATPIQSALRDGRTQTGVTIIKMDAGMDTGDIVLQEATTITADENYGALHDRLARQGAGLLQSALQRFARRDFTTRPQAGTASITRPLRRDDLTVRWESTALDIANMIRAFSPKPAARAMLAGISVKLLRARAVASSANSEATAGTIVGVEGDAALVACGQGIVALDQLTPPNRGPMSGAVFVQRSGGSR